MKVLLVEDEKLIRQFIVEYFQKQGEEVIEASDGYEGLSLLDDSFDLVLLDIMMPGIDGYEVCKPVSYTHLYYRENYPNIVLENSHIDDVMTMMIRGEKS